MPLRVSSTCAHHQEVKIALHSLWYHHTYRCSKHVEAKLIVKQTFCAFVCSFNTTLRDGCMIYVVCSTEISLGIIFLRGKRGLKHSPLAAHTCNPIATPTDGYTPQ